MDKSNIVSKGHKHIDNKPSGQTQVNFAGNLFHVCLVWTYLKNTTNGRTVFVLPTHLINFFRNLNNLVTLIYSLSIDAFSVFIQSPSKEKVLRIGQIFHFMLVQYCYYDKKYLVGWQIGKTCDDIIVIVMMMRPVVLRLNLDGCFHFVSFSQWHCKNPVIADININLNIYI